MKIIFNGGSSGTIMLFPFVGHWKSKEIREVNSEIGGKLLKSFSCLKEVTTRKKIVEKTEIIEEEIQNLDEVSYDTLSKDELITECINKGIDPPDTYNKTKLKKLLRTSIEKEVK